MKKKTFISLALITMLVFSQSICFAHEIISGFPLRWYNTSYYYSYDHRVVHLDVNGDLLVDAPYAGSAFTTMVSNWKNNSNNYANVNAVSFSTSKVDFARHVTWPSEWGSNSIAITAAYDQYGNCILDGTFDSTGIITYAQVYTNPSQNSYVSSRGIASLVLGHELGHVMGLGHPSAGTVSIMTQSQESYSKPQNHDRTDLANFYLN